MATNARDADTRRSAYILAQWVLMTLLICLWPLSKEAVSEVDTRHEESSAAKPESNPGNPSVGTKSGYEHTGIEGPASVGAELGQADEIKEPSFRLTGIDKALKPWYDFKKRASDKVGLQFGVHYAALYQGATASLGEQQAASGKLDLSMQWTLLGRKTGYAGTLVGKVEYRHRLGTQIPPSELAQELGALVTTAYSYSDWGLGVPLLYWRQQFLTNRVQVAVGKIDPTDFFDQMKLATAQTGFLNGFFQVSPTIAFPDQGLGAVAGAVPTDQLYVLAGVSDANGDPTRAGFDTFFEDSEYFTAAEVGYFSSFEQWYYDNIHVTAWHVDERETAKTPEGWGVSASVSWLLGDRWLPFLRGGYSDGEAASLQGAVSAGFGIRFRTHDLLGVGLGWGRFSDRTLNDEYVAELFYMLQLTQRLAITPDVQVIVDPPLNPHEGVIGVFGIRGRLSF